VAACSEDSDRTTSRPSSNRLAGYLAAWARIINKINLSKAEACSDKAHKTNHHKAASLARVPNKAGDSSVDLAKITNKINSSKAEDYLVDLASKIRHSKLVAYSVVQTRTTSSNNNPALCSEGRHRVLLGNLLSSNSLSWDKVQMPCGSLSVLLILVSILEFG